MFYKILTGTVYFFFLLPCLLTAQELNLDSLKHAHDTTVITYFRHNLDSLVMGKTSRVDNTRITGIERYDPITRDGAFYASLGNVGLATRDLIFDPVLTEGFDFGIRSFDLYKYVNENTRYYNHYLPITYLAYANGKYKEQLFRAAHSQGIGKPVVIAADVSVINSPGSYYNQKSDDRSLVVNGRFITKNKRYGVIANYYWNKFNVQENGGLLNDSVFEDNRESNRRIIDVNLNTAKNLVKESGTAINQYFFLTRNKIIDTLNPARNKFHLGRISQVFHFNKETYYYQDDEPLNTFYSGFDPVIDTNQTRDSLVIRKFQNTIGWDNIAVWENPEEKYIYVRFELLYENASLKDTSGITSFNSLIPKAEMVIRPFKAGKLSARANYTIGNFNNTGFLISGTWDHEIRRKEKSIFNYRAEAYLTSQEKGYFYKKYHSNYLRWENDFRNEKILMLGFKAYRKNIAAGFKLYNLTDFIYLDKNAKPAQNSGGLSVLRLYLAHNLQIKKLSLNYELVYQTISDRNVLTLPTLMGRAGIFFTLPIFRNAAIIQPGVDLFYNTAYYANNYMPSIRDFYLQDEKKIGNYIYADIFLNLMLKRFRVFLKLHHINALFGNYSYYMVPHNPMQDFAVKFGLSWTFYD